MKTFFVELPTKDGRSKDWITTMKIVKVTVDHYMPRADIIAIAKRHVTGLKDGQVRVWRAVEEKS